MRVESSTVKLCGALGLLILALLHYSTVNSRMKSIETISEATKRVGVPGNPEYLQSQVVSLQSELDQAHGKIPAVFNANQIIVDITVMMYNAGLSHRTISSDAVQTNDGILTIPMSITYEGTYAQSLEFFKQVSSHNKAWKLRSLLMHSAGSKSEQGLLSVDASMVFLGRIVQEGDA